MTPPREIRDHGASVRRRLLNLARNEGVDYNLVVQRYAAERFLYRWSRGRRWPPKDVPLALSP